MGTVTEIDDGLSYEFDENAVCVGVNWNKRQQIVDFQNSGYVNALVRTDGTGIGRHELKELMIMWLALNYPDTLAYDKLEREEKIKADTE